jgi:hypothetical protein
MEYGPVSDSSSLAKVCVLYTCMYMNGCFMCLLTIILKYLVLQQQIFVTWLMYAVKSSKISALIFL